MELLIVALKESEVAEKMEFRLRGESDMHAGGIVEPAKLEKTGRKSPPRLLGLRARTDEQPSPRRRRERYGDLELRVVAAACARKCFRPTGIEHVFAARVALEIAGRGGKERAVSALHK